MVQNLTNPRGWRTNRKIVVIESDDWGMIRMSSKKDQNELKKRGYNISQCPYNVNDRIENDKDMEGLGEVLLSVKDSKGNPAKFTINNIVANPEFDKIKSSGFNQYFFEPFTETLDRYPDTQNVMSLYKEGIKKNIFHPQLHGREHVNLRLWFERLREKNSHALEAFNRNMFTVHKEGRISGRRDNLDAFGSKTINQGEFEYSQIIKDAQGIFESIWNFRSKSFIAPCYVWHPSVEIFLRDEGIQYLQGTHVQRIPIDNSSFKVKRRYHYLGQRNKLGQLYLIRNCFFEPTESGSSGIVEKGLAEIHRSFFYKKPAIISSHRVNYIGSLNPHNRHQNLRLLRELLKRITQTWPDVEFMSTDQLGDLISEDK